MGKGQCIDIVNNTPFTLTPGSVHAIGMNQWGQFNPIQPGATSHQYLEYETGFLGLSGTADDLASVTFTVGSGTGDPPSFELDANGMDVDRVPMVWKGKQNSTLSSNGTCVDSNTKYLLELSGSNPITFSTGNGPISWVCPACNGDPV